MNTFDSSDIKIKCPYCGTYDNQMYDMGSGTGSLTFKCGNPSCGKKYDVRIIEHNDVDYEDVIKKKDKQLKYAGGGIVALIAIIGLLWGSRKKKSIKEVVVRDITSAGENGK